MPEERAAVPRVVQRAEERGGSDGTVGREVVQVGVGDRPALRRRLLHHPRIGVDADVLDPRQEVGQSPVSAGEVGEPIAVLERRPERADQLGAMT